MITLHSHRSHAGPPQGPGKYSADGQQWFDEASGQWLPVVEGQDTLCIQLEDVHATSLRAAVIARLPHHAAPTSRFVGHATSVDPRWRTYEVVSATFLRVDARSETAERRTPGRPTCPRPSRSCAPSSRPPAGRAWAAAGTPGPGATRGRGWAGRRPRHRPLPGRTNA